jgi:hypothetical protein
MKIILASQRKSRAVWTRRRRFRLSDNDSSSSPRWLCCMRARRRCSRRLGVEHSVPAAPGTRNPNGIALPSAAGAFEDDAVLKFMTGSRQRILARHAGEPADTHVGKLSRDLRRGLTGVVPEGLSACSTLFPALTCGAILNGVPAGLVLGRRGSPVRNLNSRVLRHRLY